MNYYHPAISLQILPAELADGKLVTAPDVGTEPVTKPLSFKDPNFVVGLMLCCVWWLNGHADKCPFKVIFQTWPQSWLPLYIALDLCCSTPVLEARPQGKRIGRGRTWSRFCQLREHCPGNLLILTVCLTWSHLNWNYVMLLIVTFLRLILDSWQIIT